MWWKGPKGEVPPFFNMPGGLCGIEPRMVLCFQGFRDRGIPLRDFVQATSTAAAKRYNLWPRKGSLRAGADADVVVIDPNRETVLSVANLHQNCDHNPFDGMRVRCAIDTVISRGTVLVSHGEFVGTIAARRGKFLARPPYPRPMV